MQNIKEIIINDQKNQAKNDIKEKPHYGRYKEKFDEKELPEHKKCIDSTVFQVILNSGGGYAERICYLE